MKIFFAYAMIGFLFTLGLMACMLSFFATTIATVVYLTHQAGLLNIGP